MVFVDGSPLERIENAMNVRMTMTDGELFTIDELLELSLQKTEHKIPSKNGGR
ncbi:hypothetical protein [Halalkalicoccus salilacus]|uniref:hypothetical protein n=1 Tax=Halalkalicoccus TaxID=332246 RepID=UPI002F96A615